MSDNYVVQIIDAIAEKFGMAIDWSSQNLVPYIQELMSRVISMEISMSIFWIIFAVTVTTVFCVTGINLVKIAKREDEYCWDESPKGVIGIACLVLFGIGVIASLIAIPAFTMHIIECVNIPEKIFIEYIGQFLN